MSLDAIDPVSRNSTRINFALSGLMLVGVIFFAAMSDHPTEANHPSEVCAPFVPGASAPGGPECPK